MSNLTFRREAEPDNPHAPFDGTVWGVYRDGERIGQVWQVSGVTWGGERVMGHLRHKAIHTMDWTWTGSRGEVTSTRRDAASNL